MAFGPPLISSLSLLTDMVRLLNLLLPHILFLSALAALVPGEYTISSSSAPGNLHVIPGSTVNTPLSVATFASTTVSTMSPTSADCTLKIWFRSGPCHRSKGPLFTLYGISRMRSNMRPLGRGPRWAFRTSFYIYLMIFFFQNEPIVTGLIGSQWLILEVAPKVFTVCDI